MDGKKRVCFHAVVTTFNEVIITCTYTCLISTFSLIINNTSSYLSIRCCCCFYNSIANLLRLWLQPMMMKNDAVDDDDDDDGDEEKGNNYNDNDGDVIKKKCISNSYTMRCPPVRGDNQRALASGFSYVQVDKHGITILYHLHQCRPCTPRDISC